MASSKTFLLLVLMFAVVILIFSEVSARELAETTTPPTHTGGKGGAVSCSRTNPGKLCHGSQKGNPEREHCKRNPTSRACNRNGGHERGGEEDPIHKRHGHEHGGVVVEPIHGGKGHGHERGGEGDPSKNRPGQPGRPGGHCQPTNKECYGHGGHERGGEGDPSKNRPGQPGGRPGGPDTAETGTKN